MRGSCAKQMTNRPSGEKIRQASFEALEKNWTAFPWWLRLPGGLLRQLAEQKELDLRQYVLPVSAPIRHLLSEGDMRRLRELRTTAVGLLAADRLENGGWGVGNNRALKTFFGQLPSDFDLEGSMTLSRWVIDALSFSSLDQQVKRSLLDARLVSYLDARFDRKAGGSGRAVVDLTGKTHVHTAPRHTAASVLCYVGLGIPHLLSNAKQQLKYLCQSYLTCMLDPAEVGHPDILRALCIALAFLPPESESERNHLTELIAEGFVFFWDWLTSPRLMTDQFGESAALYLRLYSLASVSDLAVIPGVVKHLAPLESFRREITHDVDDFSKSPETRDHRRWGFPALLLWSYLCRPDDEVPLDELLQLLKRAAWNKELLGDGFCVYWALLLSIADHLSGGDR